MDSSYRSSIASSHNLKRVRRRQEADASQKIMVINNDNRMRSRLHSHSSSDKPPSVSSSCSSKHRRRKENAVSRSEAPIVILLRTMFMRCFISRRKRKSRGVTTTKANDNYQTTRDDAYAHIPTNAHEMFYQLHSKSKRSGIGKSILGSSNHSNSSANRSLSRQFSSTSRDSSNSFDTNTRTSHTTPPVIVIERRIEEDPFLLS